MSSPDQKTDDSHESTAPAREPDLLDGQLLDEWLAAAQETRRTRFGVCFSNLDCIGNGQAAQRMPTFTSALTNLFKTIRKQQRVQILHGLDGVVRPGEMLLVLGRPGSGCSTFLKTLSGQTQGFDIGTESKINYQGISYHDLHRNFTGERIYLAELDVHFPELTLGQTLEFATSTRRSPSSKTVSEDQQNNEPKQRKRSHTLASFFNLNSAYDTPIGDALIRGVSGGEKRRTSIAEAYVGGAQLQCWDNSTRGLDSLTAKRFIELLRQSTDSLQSAVTMSLYQASEAMYRYFDKVLLLYEGREIFFGPIEEAEKYFTELGFARPSHATTPDFLTSLTSPRERIVQQGQEHRVPRSPDEFAAAWSRSEHARALRAEIETYHETYSLASLHPGRELEKRTRHHRRRDQSLRPSTFPLSIPEQIMACIRRSCQRMVNNYPPALSTIIANGILGTIVGSAFYQLEENTSGLRQRSILLFFATVLNSFVPAFEIDIMWAQRPIVEKQHRYAFYHPFVERLAFMFTDLPSKIIMSFLLHVPIYFMTNLRRTASAFFTYWCFMLTSLLTMAMLFRMIGAISKSRDGTMTPMSILTLLCALYIGFVVPPPYMVPWLGWFRYINPAAYTYESVLINELRNRQFPCSTSIPSGDGYGDIDSHGTVCPEVGNDRETGMVNGDRYLYLKYDYTEDHLWRNLGILFSMMAIFCVVHLLASEYIPAQKSRGEILLFKEQPPSMESRDEETPSTEPFALSYRPSSGNVSGDEQLSQSGTNSGVPRLSRHASVFHWSGITYDIKSGRETKRLLHNINGWLKPGSLTALMGVTGAGKTTLLNALAGRAFSGEMSGTVFVDGVPPDATGSFQRRVGYVQQNDIHLPRATVREALQFSALLRQSKMRSNSEKLEYVETVLNLLDMDAYADAVVGVPGEGLNVEQRKRLSIGIEMVAMPDLVLFLDEPTSGLDSQTAWSICMLLRKLAHNGHTILCTVHQPSARLFSQFNRLLLLEDGKCLYFGDIGADTAILKSYFETRGARKCGDEENPAEWMMAVSETPTESHGRMLSWSDHWRISQEIQFISEQLDIFENDHTLQSNPSIRLLDHSEDEFGASIFQQLPVLVRRSFQDQWRDPVYLYTKVAVCIGLGLANGLSFYMAENDIQGLTNLLFSVFLISQFFSILSMLIIPRFTQTRDLFEARERDSKLYSWVCLVAANIITEITWLTIISVLIFVCWYYPTGLYRNGDSAFGTTERGALSFVLIWAFTLWSSTLSQAFAASIEQPETAIQMATLCFWLSLVFCGILVSPDELPRFWIFMYRVSPLTYFFEGLAIAGVAGVTVECAKKEIIKIPAPSDMKTCGEYLAPFIKRAGGYLSNSDQQGAEECRYCPVARADVVLDSIGMGMSKNTAWRNVGIAFGYIGFNILLVFALYWICRVPRRLKAK